MQWLLPPSDPFMWLWAPRPRPSMKTRLPPALAILGAALLLSSTEAEGKRLSLHPPPQWQCRIIEKKKEQVNLPSVACSVSLHLLLFSWGFSPPEKLPLLLRFVHFLAIKCSSFVFCLTHSVQCSVVSLRLSLRCAVHTATYAAAFQEDHLSVGEGRRLIPCLPTGYVQAQGWASSSSW